MTALFFLALALAMDAFAVSIVRGAAGAARWHDGLLLGAAFGIAQGVMPLAGWALGQAFAGTIEAVDHWVAFGLLGLLGARMIAQGLAGGGDAPRRDLSPLTLLVSAFATSIDAAAAGVTLPLMGAPVAVACLVIGATTAILCTAGYLFGTRLGAAAGHRAEIFGGAVLIGLGAKILVEHLSA